MKTWLDGSTWEGGRGAEERERLLRAINTEGGALGEVMQQLRRCEVLNRCNGMSETRELRT